MFGVRERLKVGAPVSLTGRYAVQGRSARAGLQAWAHDAGAELVVRDDQSSPEAAAAIHQRLSRECSFVLGPYGSDLTRAVAGQGARGVVWNHGAAADDVQRLPSVVSVPSPASQYLVAVADVVSALLPQPSICVLTAPGRFATFAREGLEAAAVSRDMALTSDVHTADALLLCGPIDWEAERIRRHRRRGLLIGAVSPGLAEFPRLLGDNPEGLLAPVQWHPAAASSPEIGPATVAALDYIAAQAYAAALISTHCHRLEPSDPLAAARELETRTFFGAFRLASDGLQVGHQLGVIQWKNGCARLQPSASR